MEGFSMLVNEWAETVWSVLSIRPKTLHDYKRLYRRHLMPLIGHLELNDVKASHLQPKLLSLPPQTSRHTLMLAKTIWREAEIYGVSTSNPTAKLKSPAIQISPKKFLTWEEVDVLDWGRYNEQVRFLALHGLRWSEAAALTEHDIHDGYVWVNKTVNGLCKSKASVRKVPYLGSFKQLPRSYKPLQKTVNTHGITVHSLRKTFAYLLKQQGVHVSTAQRLMGHSDPVLTLKVYTLVRDEEFDEVGNRLKEFLNVMS
jgi:integrase